MGGLPFAVAHIGMVVAGGAAPINARQAFTFAIGAELPEILADTAFTAAMPAGNHGVGDALGFDQAIRHEGCPLPCAGKGIIA